MVNFSIGNLITVSRRLDRQRFIAFTQQQFDLFEAIDGNAATEMNDIRLGARTLVHFKVAAHLEACQRETAILDRPTLRIRIAIEQLTHIRVSVIGVIDVQDVDAICFSGVVGFLFADVIGLARQQDGLRQCPVLTVTNAAFNDERATDLV